MCCLTGKEKDFFITDVETFGYDDNEKRLLFVVPKNGYKHYIKFAEEREYNKIDFCNKFISDMQRIKRNYIHAVNQKEFLSQYRKILLSFNPQNKKEFEKESYKLDAIYILISDETKRGYTIKKAHKSLLQKKYYKMLSKNKELV